MKTNKLYSTIPMFEIEQSAQQQIYSNLEHDEILKLAIMPDCHAGYDLPIGAVALVDNCVCPGYIGFDIGCGVCTIDTGIPFNDILPNKENKKEFIFNKIKEIIPLGFKRHDNSQKEYKFMSASGDKELSKQVNDLLETQIGTLGGGNHFIELGVNDKDILHITIHTGSRKAGYDLASYYMNKAKDYGSKFLSLNDLGKAYMEDVVKIQEFAKANRESISTKILKDILHINKVSNVIDTPHNFIEVTDEGILHRKGAISAKKDEKTVIPINMKDGVYIVLGLGDTKTMSSASHGAGRTMSRKKAKGSIPIEDFQSTMAESGVFGEFSQSTLDESPFAYKDSEYVMEPQNGISFNILYHIKPIISIKSTD